MTFELAEPIKTCMVKKKKTYFLDNFVFRLHYFWTTWLLFICSAIFAYYISFGHPMQCIFELSNCKNQEAYNSFCWIYSYSLEGSGLDDVHSAVYPGVVGYGTGGTERKKRIHKYYQFLYFFLLVQSFFFYIPGCLWKQLESGRIEKLFKRFESKGDEKKESTTKEPGKESEKEKLKKADFNNVDNGNCDNLKLRQRKNVGGFSNNNGSGSGDCDEENVDKIEVEPEKKSKPAAPVVAEFCVISTKGIAGVKLGPLVNYFVEYLDVNLLYGYHFFFCEVLNFTNSLLQFYFIDRILGNVFTIHGFGVFELVSLPPEERNDTLIKIFPLKTKCEFTRFGPSGSIEKIDGLCVLLLNYMAEKMYILIWFWLVLLTFLTIAQIVYKMSLIVFINARYCVFLPKIMTRKREGLSTKRVRRALQIVVNRLSFSDWFCLYLMGQGFNRLDFTRLIVRMGDRLEKKYNNYNKYPVPEEYAQEIKRLNSLI